MYDELIVKDLAACGLNCARCVKYSDGLTKKLSTELLAALEGHDKVAERLSKFDETLKNYPAFKEMLLWFSAGDCHGCRNGVSGFPGCSAKTCHREKGVTFCFECDEYSCNRNNYGPELDAKWKAINNKMKEIGVEAYYQEQAKSPRY
ncbi:MAG: hypothetical protein AUK32_07915 [Candidatus Aquicultor secundus]|uniref:DUF3795 domain-containing protein n=1 Tax=Candidatus Aquicultor secundus TaxID=1973895 RepID=UPI000916DA5F|nr:DUF3795 domain-containing protein [Candidatus Aquicultor secundus]OIO84956.1 MAG: hypothetical protein AUK32_07915 [Candidatus Aquicultor secundus]